MKKKKKCAYNQLKKATSLKGREEGGGGNFVMCIHLYLFICCF